MTDRVECVVIGAGVVGLAIARLLALKGHEVLVLEAENAFGTHTSSRNSEVVHAGIYYPANSVKAKTCVRGRALLYDYCQLHGIGYQQLGKLIVATSSEQLETLNDYQAQASANGVDDLELLSKSDFQLLEPAVEGVAALWSPSTGIVDSHGLMLGLLADLEGAGGTLVTRSPVSRFEPVRDGFDLEIVLDQEKVALNCRWLVNSAGHGAMGLARASGVEHPAKNYFPAGHYFSYSGKAPFKHLVYPIADAGSLGVHATLDLGGQVKFGPDVEWREQLDYSFGTEASRQEYFEECILKYYPALEKERLQAGYVGVRPRISGPDEPLPDFMIKGQESHQLAGLVQLFGIESPGLTACLAIAEQVVAGLDPDN